MGVLRGSGGLGVCAASLSLCLWLCVWMTRTSAGLSPPFLVAQSMRVVMVAVAVDIRLCLMFLLLNSLHSQCVSDGEFS